MSSTLQHPLVRAYLDELRRLLAGSPDRDLVVDGIALHIEEAVVDAPEDRDRIRAVLDELGDPSTIAADARTPAPTAPAPFLQRRAGALLIVLLLAVGGLVVPVAGWIVGVGMLWFSKGWTVLDKLIGTFATPVVLAVAVGIGSLIWNTAAQPSPGFPGHLVLLAGYPVVALVVAIFLMRRFRPRA